MASSVRRAARASILSLICLLGLGLQRSHVPAPQPPGDTTLSAAEVRLRKLHLVRPDLIPYPIAYEVCC
jgi:hypothetical protein